MTGATELRQALTDLSRGSQRPGLHIQIGTVLSADPLTVDVCGTTQEAGRFYIADRLRAGHTEKLDHQGALSISASCPNGSHDSMTVHSGVLTETVAEPVLQPKDLVLLLTEDDQTFFLLDKVVHL